MVVVENPQDCPPWNRPIIVTPGVKSSSEVAEAGEESRKTYHLEEVVVVELNTEMPDNHKLTIS